VLPPSGLREGHSVEMVETADCWSKSTHRLEQNASSVLCVIVPNGLKILTSWINVLLVSVSVTCCIMSKC
jgi:hypothetical protein